MNGGDTAGKTVRIAPARKSTEWRWYLGVSLILKRNSRPALPPVPNGMGIMRAMRYHRDRRDVGV